MDTILIIIGVCIAIGVGFMIFLMGSFYFTSPIGKPVDPKKPYSYFFGKFSNKNKIFYATGGSSFSGGTEVVDADLKSFEVINLNYAKDKNRVYFSEHPIEVDLATFYVDENYIAKDAKYVYNIDNSSDVAKAVIIEGADPASYEKLDTRHGWGKDRNHFFYNKKIADVDYDSFELLSRNWAKDKNKVYRLTDEGFDVIEASASELVLLDDSTVRDNKKVFYSGYMHDDEDTEKSLQLNVFDYHPDSPLELMSDIHIRHNGVVYYYATPTEIDAESFQTFTGEKNRIVGGFSKDKNHVYRYNIVQEHMDAATFEYSNDNFVDKNNHYTWYGKVITPLNESMERP